jgi:hypothetical protein
VTFTDGYSMVVPSKKQICNFGPIRAVGVSAPVEKKTFVLYTFGKIAVFGGAMYIPRLGPDVQKIELYNLSGKKVYEMPVSAGMRDGAVLPVPPKVGKGTYILKGK